MVDYAAHAAANSPYPSESAVATDYDDHVGEAVDFWARVQTTDGAGFVVSYAGHTIRVVDTRAPVEAGDWVQVYGTLRPDQRLEARRVVVSRSENRRYMFVVSSIAVGLVVAAFYRRWTVDWTAVGVSPRVDE